MVVVSTSLAFVIVQVLVDGGWRVTDMRQTPARPRYIPSGKHLKKIEKA